MTDTWMRKSTKSKISNEGSICWQSEADPSQRSKGHSHCLNLLLPTSKLLWCLFIMHIPLASTAENLIQQFRDRVQKSAFYQGILIYACKVCESSNIQHRIQRFFIKYKNSDLEHREKTPLHSTTSLELEHFQLQRFNHMTHSKWYNSFKFLSSLSKCSFLRRPTLTAVLIYTENFIFNLSYLSSYFFFFSYHSFLT